MRNNLHANPMALRVLVLITCFMLVMIYNKSKAAGLPEHASKKVSVTFKQDVAKNELKVVVNSGSNGSVQLYFYSPNKKLVKKMAVNSGEETVITDIKKGEYIYQLLSYDLTVKGGTLVVQ